MENNTLNKIWEFQVNDGSNFNPKDIITKAKKQRNRQYISISAMSLTVVILIIYAFYYSFNQWNTFNLGLILMISSLSLRIVLEFYSLFYKEKKLVSLAQKTYHTFLKKYYKIRLLINYIVTPICIIVYIYGFSLLLPYFEKYLSNGFYIYILISGIISLFVIVAIIINSTIKEQRFLKQLNK